MKKKLQFIFLTVLCFFILPINKAKAEQINLPKDAEGWTIFTPSSDTDVVYIDSVSGDDNTCRTYRTSDGEMGTDPFNPVGTILPCATPAKAVTFMGANSPDWMLYKRGSVFDMGITYSRNGRSATEPTVVSSYGNTGNMPLFRGGYANNGNIDTRYLAISGLDFYQDFRDPSSPNYTAGVQGGTGMFFYSHEQYTIASILVEGCKIRYFKDNVNFAPVATNGNDGVTFRRNLILNAYSTSSAHSQGLILGNVKDLVIEENVFDHNGWLVQNDGDDTDEEGEATIFNHNMYLSDGSENMTVKNNVFIRGSSNNVKVRPGSGDIGIFDNNLIVGGEIAFGMGANDEHVPLAFKNPIVTNNIWTNPGKWNPTNRELGWFFYNFDWDGGLIENNIMVHQEPGTTNTQFYSIAFGGRNTSVKNNITYDVSATAISIGDLDTNSAPRTGISFTDNHFNSESGYIVSSPHDTLLTGYSFVNNKYFSTRARDTWFSVGGTKTDAQWISLTGDNSTFEQVSFTDPTRSIETYMAFIGETTTVDAFIDKCRNQDRYNWDIRFTSSVVNAWIKAGFETASDYRADVDGSSAITTADALLTLRNSLGLDMSSTAWQVSATTGDVNCDNVSNSADALLILRYSLGLDMGETSWCEV